MKAFILNVQKSQCKRIDLRMQKAKNEIQMKDINIFNQQCGSKQDIYGNQLKSDKPIIFTY